MVVTGPDRRVRLLDVESRSTSARTPHPVGRSPAFAPDGSQFALVQAERIRLWDGRTGEYQASLPLPSRTGAFSIAYRPRQHRPGHRLHRRQDLDRGHPHEQWVDRACAIAGRNLSIAEWEQFFPDRPYERTCPQWPPAT